MNDSLTISGLMRRLKLEDGRRSVVEIADNLGLKIEYEHWFPVTAGEFSWAGKKITVNKNAKLSADRIIAHEIGHFLVKRYELNVADEERFCDRFAENLLDSDGS